MLTDAQRTMAARVLSHGWQNGFVLRKGSRGQTVRALQLFLKDQGYDVGTADGVFGDQTEAALTAFQKAAKVNTDGVAGSKTLNAIKSALDKAPPVTAVAPADALGSGTEPAATGSLLSATDLLGPPPMPRQRPSPEMLGQGNGGVQPRLRPGDGMFAMNPPDALGVGTTSMRPQLRPGDAPDMMAMGDPTLTSAVLRAPPQTFSPMPQPQGNGGMDRGVNWQPPTDMETAMRIQRMGSPSYQSPPMQPDIAPEAPAPSPMPVPPGPMGQVASGPMRLNPGPPPFTPTPDNPGIGLPGLPPRANVFDAITDAGNAGIKGASSFVNGLFGTSPSAATPTGPRPVVAQPPAPPIQAAPPSAMPGTVSAAPRQTAKPVNGLDWILKNNLGAVNSVGGVMGLPPVPGSPPPGPQSSLSPPQSGPVPPTQQAFIDMMMPAAMEASKATGVDPRIIIAQAAQETGWGKSAPGNNYFGIKSHGQAGGQTLATTEYAGGQPHGENASFRTYASPKDSVADYATFLKTNSRYQPMLNAQGMDAQIAALGKSGYATDPNYASSVASIARAIGLPQMADAAPSAQRTPPPTGWSFRPTPTSMFGLG